MIFQLDQTGIVWCAILITLVLCQWIYFLGFFSVFFTKSKNKNSNSLKPVSVIVCCKNESANLKELLPLLMQQEHFSYEVIIVNDGSWDDSHIIIEGFKKQYSNLKNIYIDPEKKLQSGKKMAITIGVKSAKNEFLIFTDADCRPNSNLWLAQMSKGFSDKKQIVIGYSPYFKQKGWLNYFIRFETQITAAMYLSFAKRGLPYMSVGRNWGYSKTVFDESKGFSKHYYVMAGDDDLLLQNMSSRTKCKVQISPDSFVSSSPKTTLKSWIEQKRRHLQIGKYYKTSAKLITSIFSLSYFMFFIILIFALLLNFKYWSIFLIIAGIRLLVNWISLTIIAKKLKDSSTAWWFPLGEFLLMFYWLLMGAYVFFSKKQTW